MVAAKIVLWRQHHAPFFWTWGVQGGRQTLWGAPWYSRKSNARRAARRFVGRVVSAGLGGGQIEVREPPA